jgi:hypothetical protein
MILRAFFGVIITLGAALGAAVIAWVGVLAFDFFIAPANLDTAFGIIMLVFVCSAVVACTRYPWSKP